MAETVKIGNPDLLVPGTTVRLDFEVLTDNEAQRAQVISSIKKAVWADDRFDYQGSKTQVVGSMERQRDITLLSVWVTVRKTRRETRQPIEYVSMSTLDAYGRLAVMGWEKVVTYLKASVESAGKAAGAVAAVLPKFGTAAVIAAVVGAWWFFFGIPKRRST